MLKPALKLVAVAVLAIAVMPVAATRAEILIATAGPLKGQYAALGQQLKRGAEQAVADINAAGGVNGELLVLEAADDACDARQAVNVANELVAKGIKFIAGHYCSGSSTAAAKIYEMAGIVMISPSSTNGKFTDLGGWNVHRVVGRDDAQGEFAGREIARAHAGKSIAILDDGSPYGQALAASFKAALNQGGLTEKMRETYEPGQNDYDAIVQKIISVNADIVYVGGYAGEAGTLIRQLRDFVSNAQLVGPDTLLTEQFWAVAGTSGEATLATFAADPQKMEAARQLVAAFKAVDFNPEGYTLHAYAAVQAFAQAAKATGSLDGKTIAQWLRAGNRLDTVLGPISLDAKGDVKEAKFAWYKWSAGKYAETRPFP